MIAELLDQHGQPVRSKYLRGAARGAFKPCTPNQLRLNVIGMPNSGKTTFACSIPNCLILDLAGHADMVPKLAKGSHIERVRDVETLFGIIDELYDSRKNKHWQTVVIDDGDITMEWVIRWLSVQPKYNPGLRKGLPVDELWSITEYGERGAGWYRVRDEFCERTIDRLSDGGYGWVVNGNFSQKQKPLGDKIIYEYKPVMAASVIDGIRRKEHYTLHFQMSYEIAEKKVGTKTSRVGGKDVTTAIVEKRPVHRLIASIQPPSGTDEDRHAKARFIEHMPKTEDGDIAFELSRKNPFATWSKIYLNAVQATALDAGVELDDSIKKLITAEDRPRKKKDRTGDESTSGSGS